MTYSMINAPFLAIAATVLAIAVWRGARPAVLPSVVAFFVMIILTAIFDNAIIGFGLVDYNDALISGIRLGFAPLEDFAYTLAALLIIPALWQVLAPKK
jgi:lycopene cyclase domain-containing protein